jgi:hypothetical protein
VTGKPRRWEIGQITKFILFIGPVSSIFDYTTFFAMLYLFGCWDPSRAPAFQTGWFVESLMTQTLNFIERLRPEIWNTHPPVIQNHFDHPGGYIHLHAEHEAATAEKVSF